MMLKILQSRWKDFLFNGFLFLWFLGFHWIHSSSFSQVYDHPKLGLLYLGSGFLFLFTLQKLGFFKFNSLSIPLLLYVLTAALSLFNAHAWLQGLIDLCSLFLWIALALSFSQLSSQTLRTLILLSLLSSALIFGINYFPLLQNPDQKAVWLSPIGHLMNFGAFMAAHIALALVAFSLSASKKQKCFFILLALIHFAGLWVSGTRASLYGFLISLPIIFLAGLYLKQLSTRTFSLGLLLGLTFCLLLFFLKPTVFRNEHTSDRVVSTLNFLKEPSWDKLQDISSGRWMGYLATIDMIRDRPFLGHGLGSFQYVYPQYDDRRESSGLNTANMWHEHPHNEILHQASEVGLLGTVLFFSFWFFFYRKSYLYLKIKSSPVLLWSFLGLTTLIISWQFDSNFIFPFSRFYVALFAGMILKYTSPNEEVPISSPRYFRILMTLITVMAMTGVLLSSASQYTALQTQRASTGSEKLTWARRGFTLYPGNFDALFLYATTERAYGNSERAKRAIRFLYHQYPEVPLVLLLNVELALDLGEIKESVVHLEHALHNDPDFETAKHLLRSLTP